MSTSPSHKSDVEDANQQQQPVSPQVQENGAPSLPAGAVYEEDHPRAEQQGKQPHELLIDEYLADDAHGPVEPRLRAARAQVEIGRTPELEVNGVHQQYAQHRHPAYQVQAGYARGLANGTGISGLGRRCHRLNSLSRTVPCHNVP